MHLKTFSHQGTYIDFSINPEDDKTSFSRNDTGQLLMRVDSRGDVSDHKGEMLGSFHFDGNWYFKSKSGSICHHTEQTDLLKAEPLIFVILWDRGLFDSVLGA